MIFFAKPDKTPVFYLFAGINGSGKTSLFRSISDIQELGERVCIDEIAMQNGSCSDPVNIIISGRKALSAAVRCIEERISFNEETTLPGVVIENQLKLAKEKGFKTILYYVGLDSLELAISRVNKRFQSGGHFVPEALIRKRYAHLPQALERILPYIDIAFFFDNTEKFRQIALMENAKIIDIAQDPPQWLYYYFPELDFNIPD